MPPVSGSGAVTFAQVLGASTDVFEEIIANVGVVGSTIAENPILLLFTIIGVGSLAIGWFKSLLRG